MPDWSHVLLHHVPQALSAEEDAAERLEASLKENAALVHTIAGLPHKTRHPIMVRTRAQLPANSANGQGVVVVVAMLMVMVVVLGKCAVSRATQMCKPCCRAAVASMQMLGAFTSALLMLPVSTDFQDVCRLCRCRLGGWLSSLASWYTAVSWWCTWGSSSMRSAPPGRPGRSSGGREAVRGEGAVE